MVKVGGGGIHFDVNKRLISKLEKINNKHIKLHKKQEDKKARKRCVTHIKCVFRERLHLPAKLPVDTLQVLQAHHGHILPDQSSLPPAATRRRFGKFVAVVQSPDKLGRAAVFEGIFGEERVYNWIVSHHLA